MSDSYLNLVKHYENCFEKHGDTHLGVDWPKLEDVDKRYKVMLECAEFGRHTGTVSSILDFGCGVAHLYDFIIRNGLKDKYTYSGLDLSPKFIEYCKKKYPSSSFICKDVLNEDLTTDADYILMNGVFTEKRELSQEEMIAYFEKLITKVFGYCKKGIAFNVMSKNVAWERDDLFHVPLDYLSAFLCNNLSRNFIVRNDYGLFEYTVYLYK